MDLLAALGISIGVLAGLWTHVSGLESMPFLVTWTAFISWACFYAAGGKMEGLKKTVVANMAGVFWGFMMIVVAGYLKIPGSLGIAVAIGAFILCVEAHIPALSFIPGAFAGCATYFGTGANWQYAVVGLICGALLGYVSEIIGVAISNMGKSENAG